MGTYPLTKPLMAEDEAVNVPVETETPTAPDVEAPPEAPAEEKAE